MPGHTHIDLQHRVGDWLRHKVTPRGYRLGYEIAVSRGYIADVVALFSFQSRFSEALRIPIAEIVGIFECKSSRNDFLSTFGNSEKHTNRHTAIAHLHWCVIEKGIAKPDELPYFWGLLEKTGRGLRELKAPNFFNVHESLNTKIAYELLWYGEDGRPYKAFKSERQPTPPWIGTPNNIDPELKRVMDEENKG